MAVHNLEITTENLLGIVSQFSDKEFQRFVEDAKKLRHKSAKTRWTKAEAELIKEINECVFSPEKYKRFEELIEKRQDEIITPSEMDELIALTDESEELTVRRLEHLVKLTISSKKSLDEIIEELEICPPPIK